MPTPRVSVVVVNYKGTDDTLTCLRAVHDLVVPDGDLEAIVVDNASGDGSLDRLRAEVPAGTVVVGSDVNGGFTGGCNLGAARATGEYLAFVNNDARPDPRWLSEAVEVLDTDPTIGCVASKVLDWDGVDVDFVDAALTWYGMGYKPAAGSPYAGDRELPDDVLFATGSAMVVRTELFRALGGFDERYFMFYEDVDLGWRLNLLGHRVRYVPTSVVFHKHHASMASYGSFREWFLLERNALMTLYKNADDATLAATFAPALALSVRRSIAVGGADPTVLDLQRGAPGAESPDVTVSRQSLTGPYAIDSLVDHLPSLARSRAEVQATRVRSDRQLRHLLRQAIEPAIPQERYLEGHRALVDAFGLTELFERAARVLIVTGDPLGARMAGPAIRVANMAADLAREHEVRVVSTTSAAGPVGDVPTLHRRPAELREDVAWADVVVVQGFVLEQAPWIAATDVMLVVDLYDPMHIEQLEQTRGDEEDTRLRNVTSTTRVLNDLLRRGDYFLVASEAQRHFWLGQLAGVGRLNPLTYDQDASLGALVGVVPFGLPDLDPQSDAGAIRGVVPGIGPDDKVVIWAGGIYNWFDPLTVVRAVGELARTRPDLRLFFLGTAHPNPDVPAMEMVNRTRALAEAEGLVGRSVFFNDDWVEYALRADYLLDSDAGISTHFDNLETTFAFRTRILDYLWAGLPMVVTAGDTFADLVREHELGVVVPEGDVAALAAALDTVLYDDAARERFAAHVRVVREQFRWATVLTPLRDAVREPRRAVDAALFTPRASAVRAEKARYAVHRVRSDLGAVRHYAREDGLGVLGRRAVQVARARLGRR